MKARALPFERLDELPGSRAPWVPGGPLCPRNAIVAGSWFLTREAELAGARIILIEFFPVSASSPPRVRWHLPTSKCDQRGLGVARSHFCRCGGEKARKDCPYHALLDQRNWLMRAFPDKWVGNVPAADLPLFPTAAGTQAGYQEMVATIRHAASLLGVPDAPDGSERVSGHSLRATGAQGMARRGADLWSIQLLGRWGSDAVRGYVREAHLESASTWAARAPGGLGQSLDTLVEAVLEKVVQRLNTATPTVLLPAVDHAVSEVCADALTSEDLAEEVAFQATQILTPSSPSTSSGSTEGPLRVVQNAVTACWHAVQTGPPNVEARLWSTKCGWRFGLAPRPCFVLASTQPGDAKFCLKCGQR